MEKSHREPRWDPGGRQAGRIRSRPGPGRKPRAARLRAASGKAVINSLTRRSEPGGAPWSAPGGAWPALKGSWGVPGVASRSCLPRPPADWHRPFSVRESGPPVAWGRPRAPLRLLPPETLGIEPRSAAPGVGGRAGAGGRPFPVVSLREQGDLQADPRRMETPGAAAGRTRPQYRALGESTSQEVGSGDRRHCDSQRDGGKGSFGSRGDPEAAGSALGRTFGRRRCPAGWESGSAVTSGFLWPRFRGAPRGLGAFAPSRLGFFYPRCAQAGWGAFPWAFSHSSVPEPAPEDLEPFPFPRRVVLGLFLPSLGALRYRAGTSEDTRRHPAPNPAPFALAQANGIRNLPESRWCRGERPTAPDPATRLFSSREPSAEIFGAGCRIAGC
ncbi:cytochrome b5 domain-containing protein 1 isoform X2 [Struthio camelus]|uniref:cytochrome b5 domain-containing protein 1 isoform X2 n=1 Tax=Struthio camelus TaxID=8801 RepID=UPI003604025A